jgi:hypothetical protein
MNKVHLELKRNKMDAETETIIKFFLTSIEAHAFKMGIMLAAKVGDVQVVDVIEEERRKRWTSTQS